MFRVVLMLFAALGLATRAAVGLDDDFFADRIHLNGRGRGRLAAWVRTRLTELGSATGEGTHERSE